MPVIPAIQEAETGLSPFEASIGKVSETLTQKTKCRAGDMAQVIELLPNKKQNVNKRAGNMVQTVECLLSRCEAGFNP
jgi:hypothetical protein